MLTEKEAAALTRLEQERERRINQKIESGAAVRVLLPIVAGARESVDADRARNRKLEELRRNGETREVYFDEVVIITGVPRPGASPTTIPRPTRASRPRSREDAAQQNSRICFDAGAAASAGAQLQQALAAAGAP